jgi:RNA polymerase sigma-70 factor (ECF subfamily)
MNDPDDAQLLHRCMSGDAQAVETLVNRYQVAVFRLALAILEDPAEAEEATRDAFVAALTGLGSFQGKAAFQTWLFAITTNRCRGLLRQRQRGKRLEKILKRFFLQSGGSQAYVEEQVTRGEGEGEIHMAVNALDEKYRLPLILRYYHELPIAEIAQVLGVSERIVHRRLRAAHQDLTGRLDGFER